MTLMTENPSKKRIVSGMRCTGKIHLGNYHGALKNWLDLQHKYDCYFFAADWHALTTHHEGKTNIRQLTWDMLTDWLAAGLDPNKCKIFIQSGVPEHSELHLLLSMITPVSWLERVPTYKDQQEKLKELDLSTYGFLGYPVLQSADILLYKASLVPVGEDQVSHIELTREVARRFNHIFGKKAETGHAILPEPEAMLTKTPKFPGIDGQKMSKSYNNTIYLTEEPESVTKKIKTMPTDPARVKRTDPGNPEKCPVWEWHKIYSDTDVKQWVQQGCTSAGIGCLDCKRPLIDKVLAEQQPILERAVEYKNNPSIVRSIVESATEEARDVAQATMVEVRNAIGVTG